MSICPVFKAYDIRGLSPDEIDAAFAARLGRAIAFQFAPKRVLVGRDARKTSQELERSLLIGLTESGVDVTRIGLCSTPMFNVTLGLAHERGTPFDLGVMVTASHNPGSYNGFKITYGDCLPVGQGSGMEELAASYEQQLTKQQGAGSLPATIHDDPEARDRYVTRVLSLAKLPSDMSRMKVAIDAGNGMAGAVLPELIKRLAWLEIVPLYFEPDGTFPNHEANPLKRETLTPLIETVRREACAVGIAFDGDADRVGFVDETGEPIPGDLLTAMLAEEILVEHPDSLVLYDVRSSWAVPEAIAEAGGHAEMCKVGHAHIKRAMRETHANFAGELSMHFYFKELWNCESSDLAMLLVLRRMYTHRKTLSELWQPLKRYAKSEEINFEIADPQAALSRLEAAYAPSAQQVSHLDGLRCEFRTPHDPLQAWWFNARVSNTEPFLRLNVEAATETRLQEKLRELQSYL